MALGIELFSVILFGVLGGLWGGGDVVGDVV